jgi:hypothetical protein
LRPRIRNHPAGFGYLHRDLESLVDEPSADDLDAIDKSGFVRAAVKVTAHQAVNS